MVHNRKQSCRRTRLWEANRRQTHDLLRRLNGERWAANALRLALQAPAPCEPAPHAFRIADRQPRLEAAENEPNRQGLSRREPRVLSVRGRRRIDAGSIGLTTVHTR